MKILVAVLFLLWIKDILGTNVALHKKGLCGTKRNLHKKITDGKYTLMDSAYFGGLCTIMRVLLVHRYKIFYVVVYEGISSYSYAKRGHWDFYFVRLVMFPIKYRELCGYYHNFAVPPENKKGNRVNCIMYTGRFFDEVNFTNNVNRGYVISEIEVFAFGDPDRNAMIYRGCFKNFEYVDMGFNHSVTTCGSFCTNYTFAALQSDSCFCGNKEIMANLLDNSNCIIRCKYESNRFCGGKGGYSVYAVNYQLPVVHGCFEFYWLCPEKECLEDLEMTTIKCVMHCQDHLFAGVRMGKECTCYDEIPEVYELDMMACNFSCFGKMSTYCGGYGVSIFYGTCRTDVIHTNCTSMFRCLGQMDEIGVCTGGCQEGYIGDSCAERDPTITTTTTPMKSVAITRSKYPTSSITERAKRMITNPCLNEPCLTVLHSTCVVVGDSFLCECNTGYNSSKDGKGCEDIDECSSSPCDSDIFVCTNSQGAYECNCKPGLVLDYNDGCTGNLVMIAAAEWSDRTNEKLFLAISIFLLGALVSTTIYKVMKRASEST